MDVGEKVEAAAALKDKGNAKFKAGRNALAISKYKACKTAPPEPAILLDLKRAQRSAQSFYTLYTHSKGRARSTRARGRKRIAWPDLAGEWQGAADGSAYRQGGQGNGQMEAQPQPWVSRAFFMTFCNLTSAPVSAMPGPTLIYFTFVIQWEKVVLEKQLS